VIARTAVALLNVLVVILRPLRKYVTVPVGTPLPGDTTRTCDARFTETILPRLFRTVWTVKIDCVLAVETMMWLVLDRVGWKLESPE